MLACALSLLVSAGPVSGLHAKAPRIVIKSAPLVVKPYWLIALGDDVLADPRFPRPEPTSAFNMYAESGGLQVGPGLRTNAWVYDCAPDKTPQCKIGRADITLPKNLGPLIGLTLHMGKLIMTELRNMRRIPPPKGGLAGLLFALPVINLSFLDKGAYTNVLFAY